MANRFHITRDDSVSPCRAQSDDTCPFAGLADGNNHFESAVDAAVVLEDRLANEYGGTTTTVQKNSTRLAASGATPKEVRDALRKENPDWGNAQVHTVQKSMMSTITPGKTKVSPKMPESKVRRSKYDPATRVVASNYSLDSPEFKRMHRNFTEIQAILKDGSELHREISSRAYHHKNIVREYERGRDNLGRPTKITYEDYEKSLALSEFSSSARSANAQFLNNAQKEAEKAQTDLENAGFGHTIPDNGNTIRVRTQAQKVLLRDELMGQISDGYWETHLPIITGRHGQIQTSLLILQILDETSTQPKTITT